MTPKEIFEESQRVEAEDGPWRCRMNLGHGVLAGPDSPRTERRSHELFRAVKNTLGKPIEQARVLDLGALNGALGAPFAEAGAQVRFVEGRETNCRKIRLLLEGRGFGQCACVRADVREFEIQPPIDVVLCCGLLYHLRADEALQLLERIAGARPRILVLDSQFAFLTTDEVVRIAPDGEVVQLRGQYHREFEPGTAPEEKLAIVDRSLNNEDSFWFDARDIITYLDRLGFTTILQHAVVWELLTVKKGHAFPDDPRYRRMLLCYRG